MAAEIKKHVKIPLIAVANIKEPDVAEAILREGCCDLVGLRAGTSRIRPGAARQEPARPR
jgi:2,4-dienoyl-CoA reductase-like NADH-dependent reductase (Old Yellow Enzyme family)